MGSPPARLQTQIGEICDLPGLLFRRIEHGGAAGGNISVGRREVLAVQVADATFLKRSLKLTKSLLARGIPVVLALTMGRKFRARGGKLDCGRLSEKLGIKCVEVDALRKKSVREFSEYLKTFFPALSGYKAACLRSPVGERTFDADAFVAQLLSECYSPRLSSQSATKLSLNGFFALPAFFLLAGLVFYYVRGAYARRLAENTFETLIGRLAEFAGGEIDSPIVRSRMRRVDRRGGERAFLIPQIALMYLFLDFLEERFRPRWRL
ncbi:MAG: FeoB small GTPase domain-containing protein [Christensenellaceae bacterium]